MRQLFHLLPHRPSLLEQQLKMGSLSPSMLAMTTQARTILAHLNATRIAKQNSTRTTPFWWSCRTKLNAILTQILSDLSAHSSQRLQSCQLTRATTMYSTKTAMSTAQYIIQLIPEPCTMAFTSAPVISKWKLVVVISPLLFKQMTYGRGESPFTPKRLLIYARLSSRSSTKQKIPYHHKKRVPHTYLLFHLQPYLHMLQYNSEHRLVCTKIN